MTPVEVVERLPDLASGEVRVKTRTVDIDEGPRADTSLEGLARLRRCLPPRLGDRRQQLADQSDGAGALILASEKAVKQFDLKPLARFVSFAVRGVPPEIMGIGPIEAILAALRAGLKLDDLGWIELNEAFAAQALAVIGSVGLNPDVVNPMGGAIALGHPLGATGAIRAATVVHALRRRNLVRHGHDVRRHGQARPGSSSASDAMRSPSSLRSPPQGHEGPARPWGAGLLGPARRDLFVIKTATLNGVATIEIARPEKKNALTIAMYAAMADAIVAASADNAVRALLVHRTAGDLHLGQRSSRTSCAAAPAARRELAGVPVHARCCRATSRWSPPSPVPRSASARRCCCTATSSTCPTRRARDALRRAGPGAGVRVQPRRAAADGQCARPRGSCSATRSPAPTPSSAASPTRCFPRARSCCTRRVAERFNALPPGAVQQTKRLLRRARRPAELDAIAAEGDVFGQRLRSPEAMEAFSAFFQKRKPDFSKF